MYAGVKPIEPRFFTAPCFARSERTPGRGMIATSGGLPAASRVRIAGTKSRAVVYCTSMPVFFLKAAVTFRKASFSAPPHSERASIFPAERAAGFELAVAANDAAIAPSTTASRTSQERRFNSIPPPLGSLLAWPPRLVDSPHRLDPLPSRSYLFQFVETRLSSVSG